MAPLAPSSRSMPPTEAAREQLRRAEQLLGEQPAPLSDVARHLHDAWTHLHGELRLPPATDDEHRAEAVAQMARLLHVPVLVGEEAARRLVFAEPGGAQAQALVQAPALHEGLQAEARALRRAIDDAAARRDGSASLGIGLALVVLVLLAFAPLIGDIGGTVTTPWRGRYYDNDKFEGEAREHFDRLLSFDFGRDSPLRGIAKDRFSIRWDTCLIVEEDTTVRFQLTSDDGSRLHVDGEEVVDNWGDHGTESKTTRISLDAGLHYLEVEYYEAKHGANIKLEIAMGKDKLEVVPVDIIRAPGEGEDPCGG